MKKNKFDLSIIILNYNTQFWLKKVLSSLKNEYLKKTKYSVEVIVVDNNSSDDSVKMVKQSFRWVRLIQSKENNGFSAGNNLALKTVSSRYTMLVNSDIEFTSESNLDILIEYMDNNTKTGIVTPRVNLPTGTLDWSSHRGEPTPWASFTYSFKLSKWFPKSKKLSQYHQTYKDLNVTHEIDACSGAAMMVRTSFMKKIGFLDERFFMYAEDLDWCKRFRDKNYKVVFIPKVVVIHHKYKSGIKSNSSKTATIIKGHFYDTMLQYYDKHYKNEYHPFVRNLIKTFLFVKKGGL